MTAITDWVNPVARIVPSADERLITEAVRQAVIQFAEDAKVHAFQDTQNTVASTATYDITLPANTVLLEIRTVFYDDVEIDLFDIDELRIYDKNFETTTGTPKRFYVSDEDTIGLAPIPSAVAVLRVSAYARPAEDATAVDDRYWRDDRDTITFLAASILLGMPQSTDRPWGDPQVAYQYAMRYQTKLDQRLSDGPRHKHSQKRRRAKPFLSNI